MLGAVPICATQDGVRPSGAPYEISSGYAGGVLKACKELGLWSDALEAQLSTDARALALSPWSRSWWPGPLTEEIARVIVNAHGPAKLEEVGLLTTRTSVGPIITPLVSVIGAIFGLTPHSLFERISDLASTSARGIALEWRASTPTGGALRISYPPGCGEVIAGPLWRGACRFVFELSRVQGHIVSTELQGSVWTISLRWEPASGR